MSFSGGPIKGNLNGPAPHPSRAPLLPSPFSRVGTFGQLRPYVVSLDSWSIEGDNVLLAPPAPSAPTVSGSVIEA
jgi:hypothetical protein